MDSGFRRNDEGEWGMTITNHGSLPSTLGSRLYESA